MAQAGHNAAVSLHEWLVARVVSIAGLEAGTIRAADSFSRLGIDSVRATELAGELSARLGRPISPTLFWEYPTLEALTRHLSGPAVPWRAANRGVARRGSSTEVEPIAVVGLACRLPGAPDAEAYWHLLDEGGDAIREVPKSRWRLDDYYDPDPDRPSKMHTRWGGFLEQVDRFDADFFGIPPAEASQVDPQQRLMLELAWEALEDAGIPSDTLRGAAVGVFAGAWRSDYGLLAALRGSPATNHSATGQSSSVIAGRISYAFGFEGPSLVVDTACSSSLVAVHLACRSLLSGEAELALAGGVNLILAPQGTLGMCRFGGLSPDGRCKSFDARADGYVRSEGAGLVVLKPFSKALADGDRITCLIRGSAVNSDGSSNGLSAPSPGAQEAVVRAAVASAGVAPREIQYVEAHGTGTRLGDPIEAQVLGKVLGEERPDSVPLVVGSAKSNVGHLESAAGIAGLIKLALAIRHRRIPASLHFETPNPLIPFEQLKIRVARTSEDWPAPARELLAGVSSFGFSGTNCHLVVSEAFPPPAWLFTASADSSAALRERAGEMETRADVDDSWRLAATVRTPDELAGRLAGFRRGADQPGLVVGRRLESPGPVFVFSGQGAYWKGAGRRLLAEEPVFRAALAECDHLARDLVGWSLLEEIAGPGAAVDRLDVGWPVHFALQIALAALWRAWGVEPAVVIGHSIGEVAAAVAADALDLADALRVIVLMGEIAQRASGSGTMALVELPASEAERIIGEQPELAVAIESSPRAVVLSGAGSALRSLLETLRSRGVFCRSIRTEAPVHSPRMEPFRDEMLEELAGLTPRLPRLRWISTVTGAPLERAPEAEYWPRCLIGRVLFHHATQRAVEQGHSVFLEVSPHPIVARSLEQTLSALDVEGAVVDSLHRGEDDRTALLDAAGTLYTRGVPVRHARLRIAGSAGERSSRSGELPGAQQAESEPCLLPLSARSPEALRALAGRFAEHLERSPHALADICYTAGLCRGRQELRLGIVARDRAQARRDLESFAAGAIEPPRRLRKGDEPRIAFIFPGQGAQWLGMGRRLLATEPVFRRTLEDCDRVLLRFLDFSVLATLEASAAASQEIDVVQPTLFAVEMALAALWRSWGIEPDAVVGQSMGEVAAACVCGAIDLQAAARIVCVRSRLLRRIAGRGAMAVVQLPRQQTEQALEAYDGQLSLAVLSSPQASVVAGDPEAIQDLMAELASGNVYCRRIKVDVASHSPQTEPLLDELRQGLGELSPRAGEVPFYSTVSGGAIAGDELDAGYWVRNLRQPALFAPAVEKLLEEGIDLFLELSPHPILSASVEQCVQHLGSEAWVLPSLRREEDERETMLSSLAALYAAGCRIEWRRLFLRGGRRVALPTYPWQRRRYWFEQRRPAAPSVPAAAGDAFDQWLYETRWKPLPLPKETPVDPGLPWVIFADRGGYGAELAKRLRQRGERCTCVWAAEGFESRSPGFAIGPDRRRHYRRLLARLDDAEQLRVVHLWSLDSPGGESDCWLEAQRSGCLSVLHLLQTFSQRCAGLWLVTRGAQAADSRPIAVQQAPLWGFGRTVAVERPHLWGGLVDLDPDGAHAPDVDLLLAEVTANPGEEALYRGGERYVSRLAASPRAPASPPPRSLNPDATYLITGGLGALGRRFARHLVARGARHLLLLGRGRLPHRSLRTGTVPEGWQPKISALRELEEAGVEVRYAAVDVSDPEAMEEVLASPARPLAGIVHAAGTVDLCSLEEMDEDRLRAVMSPKIAGAQHLHQLTAACDLDFFVLASSAAATWGAAEMAHYAAANHLLDALAHHRRATGLAALSIAWGRWGEGAALTRAASYFDRLGLGVMAPQQALAACDHLLAQDAVQRTVAKVDWQAFKPIYQARRERPFLAEVGNAEQQPGQDEARVSETADPRPAREEEIPALAAELQHAGETEHREMLADYVAGLISELLGFGPDHPLDTGRGFFQLGMDSITTVRLRQRLESGLQLSLPFDRRLRSSQRRSAGGAPGQPFRGAGARRRATPGAARYGRGWKRSRGAGSRPRGTERRRARPAAGPGARGAAPRMTAGKPGPEPDHTQRLQRALAAIRQLRGELKALEEAARQPIAVVGIGCRFPGGANDPDAFWDLLAEGRDALSPIPETRWDVARYYDSNPEAAGKMYVDQGGFLGPIDVFDADFFAIAAARGGRHGSATAAAAGGFVGGTGECRHRRRLTRRQPGRRLRGHDLQRLSCSANPRQPGRHQRLPSHRQRVELRGRTPRLHPGAARALYGPGHGVLPPPWSAFIWLARACARGSATWRWREGSI